MPRRSYALVAIVACVVVALFVLPRRAERRARDAASSSPAAGLATAASPVRGARVPSPAVRLVPGEAIAGTAPPPARPAPHGAFEGRVVSSRDGAGLAGAQLTFARAEEAAAVTAERDGAFRFEPRAPGRWSLAGASAAGHLPYAPAWGESAVALEARPGEVVRGVTVTLEPEVRYAGRVLAPDRQPVAGAEVALVGGAGADAVVTQRGRWITDAAGAFEFTAPEGALLEAWHEGFATGRARVDYAVRSTGRLTVVLQPRSPDLLALAGQVEDASGAPAANAVVTAWPKDVPGAPVEARTGPGGGFRLEDLAAGTWVLVARRPGSAPARAEAAAGTTNLRLRLPGGGAVQGRVRERGSGAAVTAFTVVVQALDFWTVAVIDPEGRFLLDDLPPGAEAVLSVVAPGRAPSRELRVAVPAAGASPASVEFELGGGGSLAGAVVTRGTGRPVPQATVDVEGLPAGGALPVSLRATADAEGRFELRGLPEGAVNLSVSAPGHHARVLSVSGVREGERAGPVTVELSPLAPGEEPRVELAGIGAMLVKDGEVVRITTVVAGGGAAEAGLAAGDEVLAIDGASVARMTPNEYVPLVRGPEGSYVRLTVVKNGDPARARRDVAVPRRIVRG